MLAALVADLKARTPDHIAVTGDLVNLSLPSEFVAARAWLDALGNPRDVSVVPGNHDAYVQAKANSRSSTGANSCGATPAKAFRSSESAGGWR